MPEFLPLGKHRYYVDKDLFVLDGHGEISVKELEELFRTCWRIGDEYGYWLVLVDARAGVGMSADARRYVGQVRKIHPSGKNATAIFGGGLIELTFITLIRNVIRLLRGEESSIAACRTEAEARAWLDEQRELLRPPGSTYGREDGRRRG